MFFLNRKSVGVTPTEVWFMSMERSGLQMSALLQTKNDFSILRYNKNVIYFSRDEENGVRYMRRTKIICTLGPAVDSDEMVAQLMKNGMNCARLNFSHGTHEEQKIRMDRVKNLRKKLNLPVALLMDTKGPEIRLKDFEGGSTVLEAGQTFILDTDREKLGDQNRIGLTYDKLYKFVQKDSRILIDDGKIAMDVVEIRNDAVVCRVINGGKISNHKSINIPNVNIDMPYISEVDRRDILFAVEQNVDYIAASFVRSADDVRRLRNLLKDNDAEHIRIISKIENRQGVDNMDEIIEASDGVMVARGDLGVEISFQEIPAIQKKLIAKCNEAGKIVVTATQMLESMTTNPRPTRAEVSDVANAIYDGTSAIMLSGESAAGAYPIEAVKTMAEIATCTEKNLDYDSLMKRDNMILEHNICNAICSSAYSAATYLDAKAIVVVTMSGKTAELIANFKPKCPIIAATVSKQGYNQLALKWGVQPIMAEQQEDDDSLFPYAVSKARETELVEIGDTIVAVAGSRHCKMGVTDMLRITHA